MRRQRIFTPRDEALASREGLPGRSPWELSRGFDPFKVARELSRGLTSLNRRPVRLAGVTGDNDIRTNG